MAHSQQGVPPRWLIMLPAVLIASSVCFAIRPDVECEGDACAQVTITWVDAKQQYKVQNNSTDRWVKVEAANLVTSASLCLGPTRNDHLSLSTVVGAFHATLVEENCGRKP